jgi:hypothetical protein
MKTQRHQPTPTGTWSHGDSDALDLHECPHTERKTTWRLAGWAGQPPYKATSTGGDLAHVRTVSARLLPCKSVSFNSHLRRVPAMPTSARPHRYAVVRRQPYSIPPANQIKPAAGGAFAAHRSVTYDAYICWQVDAFTDVPFRGNPAAVCLLELDGAGARIRDVDRKWMLAVAAEFNAPVTAFLAPAAAGGGTAATPRFHIRWFTTVAEVRRHHSVRSFFVVHSPGERLL